MRRWRVIVVAALLVVIGTAVPLALLLNVSWRMALDGQERQLRRTAEIGVARAASVYADAAATLRAIAATDYAGCSPAHIERMRRLTIDSLATENIGFIPGGILQCDAWGPAEQRVSRPNGGTVLPDGMVLTVNEGPHARDFRPMMVLRLGNYEAVVDQLRFFPVLDAPSATLEIRAPGGLLISTGAAAIPAFEEPQASGTSQGDGWTVVARQPRLSFSEHLRAAQFVLFPAGLVLAGAFGALAVVVLRRRLSAHGELAQAVRQREFIAYYQPIIELASGRCVGAEALVRWRQPDGTLVRPDLFIPLAEDSGLIQPITDQVIAAVIRECGALLRSERGLHISINICSADLGSGRILGVLESALKGTGIEPRQIWLEATERGFIDIEGARRTLAELRRRGHMTAIDDFGTGYSGLKYLQSLPVDALKIDKSFIEAVGTEAPTRQVTEHIIAMARELKLRIVAEGVESEAQAAYLRERGVDFAQGWLFARAMPVDEFTGYCTRSEGSHSAPGAGARLAAE